MREARFRVERSRWHPQSHSTQRAARGRDGIMQAFRRSTPAAGTKHRGRGNSLQDRRTCFRTYRHFEQGANPAVARHPGGVQDEIPARWAGEFRAPLDYPPARNARAALRIAGATASISLSRKSRSGTLSPSSGFTPVSHACTTAGESCSAKVRIT